METTCPSRTVWVWPKTPQECVGMVVGTHGVRYRCVGREGNDLRCVAADGTEWRIFYVMVQVLVGDE